MPSFQPAETGFLQRKYHDTIQQCNHHIRAEQTKLLFESPNNYSDFGIKITKNTLYIDNNK